MSSDDSSTHSPKIRRGYIPSLSFYEITDYELETLKAGSPATLLLNFAIFLLSVAASFWITVFSTEIKDPRRYAVFFGIAIFSTINGLILGILWWRQRGSVAALVSKIKARIPVDTVAPSAEQTPSSEEKGESK